MSLIRQIKPVKQKYTIQEQTPSNNSALVVALVVVAIAIIISLGVLVTKMNAIHNVDLVQPTIQIDNTAAMIYCTEKTKRYAKDDIEFRMGVEGCMDYDRYAKSLIKTK